MLEHRDSLIFQINVQNVREGILLKLLLPNPYIVRSEKRPFTLSVPQNVRAIKKTCKTVKLCTLY